MKPLSPYGLENQDLVKIPGTEYSIRNSVLEPFLKLSENARKAGFDIRVESAFRPFDRQLSIWNGKATGRLKLLDADGVPLREIPKDPAERMRAILLWSALPGASRHHFGTELDVVDGNRVPEGYEVELTESECDGMFAPFHGWLSEQIRTGKSFGFERVFVPGRGKIRPERWHISHRESAAGLEALFEPDILRKIYERSEMELKEVVLEHFDELMRDYVFPYFKENVR